MSPTVAFALALLAAPPSFAANDSNVCNSDGKQTTLNGKTHTCGTCSSGAAEPTRMWFVGDLTAEKAVEACQCAVDKNSCTTGSQQVVTATRNQKATQAKGKGGKSKSH
jgi:hypothetical protein